MLKHAVAAATLVMTVLLMVGGLTQALSVSGPRYAPGDSWTYDIRGVFPSPPGISPGSFDLSLSGTRTERVTAVSGAKPNMAEEANLRMSLTTTFQGTTSSFVVDLHTTLSITSSDKDGAFFANVSSQSGYFSSNQRYHGTFHTYSTVLQDTFAYPLETGHKYATVAREEATLTLGPTFPPFTYAATTSTDYVALPSESVTVKAGTFNTLPLATWANTTDLVFNGRPYPSAATHGNITMKYFAADVGNYVKTISYDGKGREMMQEELSSYSYGGRGPTRALQIFSEPYFWLSMVGIAAAAVLVAVLVVRRRRVPAVPPPPTDTGAMVGSQELASPPPPAGEEPSAPPPPVQPSEPSQEEERPPSGPL